MTPNANATNPWAGMRDAAGQPQPQQQQGHVPAGGGPSANLGDLDSYAGDYKPEHSFPADLESLANGDYDCEITAAAMDSFKGDNIARISLRINGGAVIRWTCWLNSPTAVNSFCAEMLALGFDAHKWGPKFGRPLSVEIPKAVGQLAGKKFRGHKSSRRGQCVIHKTNNCKTCSPDMPNDGGGKWFHDLRVICPIDAARPMPPIQPQIPGGPGGQPQPLAPPLAQPPSLSPAMPPNMPLPQPASVTGTDSEIPF